MPIARLKDIGISHKVEGQGEPLVMIMGFSANRSGWTAQVPFFRKYYRTITFDNRGVGKSEKPQGPYSTRMMADDTVGLMDCLGIERAHVMGASMGGMIAQELAINYPERVNRLVLASTYACQNGTSGDAPEQAKLAHLPPQRLASAMIGLALNRPIYRFTFGVMGMIQSRFIGVSARAGIAGQMEACRNHNTLERLALITAPTLVIVGTHDRVIAPVSSEVIASKIPNARLVKLEGGSHSLSIEMKGAFNREVLSFLKG
jgi:pimeloyl-ACP methyl ester carboxylesterase